MRLLFVGLLFVALAGVSLLIAGSAFAQGQPESFVCIEHVTGDGIEDILVEPDAVAAHLRHGDSLGDACSSQPMLVTLCHAGAPGSTTILVGAEAVPAHLAHGDVLGECPVCPPLICGPPGPPAN